MSIYATLKVPGVTSESIRGVHALTEERLGKNVWMSGDGFPGDAFGDPKLVSVLASVYSPEQDTYTVTLKIAVALNCGEGHREDPRTLTYVNRSLMDKVFSVLGIYPQ